VRRRGAGGGRRVRRLDPQRGREERIKWKRRMVNGSHMSVCVER
jgi:hypothetical protein